MNHTDPEIPRWQLLVIYYRRALIDQFRLETALDDLRLPWRIDLCRYHAITEPALKEEIDRWGKEIYRKDEPSSCPPRRKV